MKEMIPMNNDFLLSALPFFIRALVFFVGATIVFFACASAIRTFVLPRSAREPITTFTFQRSREIFGLVIRLLRAETFEQRDAVYALFAPVSLLALPVVWLMLVNIGYTAMFWATGVESWWAAFVDSGSSLLTLGFAPLSAPQTLILAFSEATIGLIMVALLISYLPTIYSAFSQRETAVTMLETRAGAPPWAVTMIIRYQRIGGLSRLALLWQEWEAWFAQVEETHTSLVALVFFRSPHAHRSWVTAAGSVLDAAALMNAVVDAPHDPQSDICLRSGYLALRHIADFFLTPYNENPHYPTDPISISRAEFETACVEMAAAGVPLKADREQAWRDFAGWRVNYDTVLIALAELTLAPYAPWSSDRGLARQRTAGPYF